MKVLMIGNSPKVKGGITTVISQIRSHDWKTLGVEFKFISTYLFSNKMLMIFYFVFSLVRVLISLLFFSPDIIHIHMSYKGSFYRKFIIFNLCKIFNKKVIFHLHGSEFENFYYNSKNKGIINDLLSRSDAIIVLGDDWEKIIKKIEPNARTLIINNAISVPDQSAKFNDRIQIIFVGVLIKRKGVADLIKALHFLDKVGFINKYNCTIVIAGDGQERVYLEEMSKQLQLDRYIKFVGWIDNIKRAQLLLNSQLLVLPSYNEGLPMAILEAISYGLPVVSTNVGSINEAVIDGGNGFLVDAGDQNSLALKIEQIFESSKQWETFSSYSKKLAKKKFSDEKMFEALFNIYTKLKENNL